MRLAGVLPAGWTSAGSRKAVLKELSAGSDYQSKGGKEHADPFSSSGTTLTSAVT